ncbi:hypothetical protein QTP88_004147 [Uroleucon formosanum]
MVTITEPEMNLMLSGDRTEEMADNVKQQSYEKIKEFSIAVYENTNITNIPQLAIFIHRVYYNFDITEEFLDWINNCSNITTDLLNE